MNSVLGFKCLFIPAVLPVQLVNKHNLIIIGIIFITLIPEIKKADKEADYPISIIQPSSDPLLKYEKDYYKKIEKNLINLFAKLPEESLLVVLPEAELPYSIQDIRFQEFINKLPKPIDDLILPGRKLPASVMPR